MIIIKTNDILVVLSNGSANLVGRFLFIDNLKKNFIFWFQIRMTVEMKTLISKIS